MRNIRRLREFVVALTHLAGRHGRDEFAMLRDAGPLLAALIAHDDWLPEAFAETHSAHHQEYLLHCDAYGRFAAVSLVLAPGQKTPLHDHSVWCLMGVLRGTPRFDEYRHEGEGVPMQKTGEHLCQAGDIEVAAAVFLDLKFHDIPNTVARAVEAAVRLDVQMLTVHASGGLAMMQAAEQAAQTEARKLDRLPPLVLGVTVLTSLDDASLAELGVNGPVTAQVARLSRLAAKAGLLGLVCSPLEIKVLRAELPTEMQLVTPGIRPAGTGADDQKRTLTPREALAAGADWLVIGRPICAAPDPRAAAEQILASLEMPG